VSTLEWLGMARHGESTGNVAWREAESEQREEIGIGLRDADVPLSETGRRQAEALGRRLAAMPVGERPTVVYSSPYVRAVETARIALAEVGDGLPLHVDERLRDRENGVLYALTWRGIAARFPEEMARKRLTGKFYYRPPGGESWADVALRLRGALADIERRHPGARVLIVAHDAVVILTRYVVEWLTEQEVLEIERTLVPNASLTSWSRADGELRLVASNSTDHLDAEGLPA
jgi:broad specificity phosphatase PhoE